MKKILWISTCCVHDLASESMLQVRNMIASLADRSASLVCLSSTIRSNNDPNSLHPAARELITHSANKFQFADDRVQYIYTITGQHPLANMTTLEQSQFYNEMTPIICGFKPDVVITSSSDIVSMACLNLAKHLDIPTVFVLLEPPAREFNFADVDLIVSSSESLTKDYVITQGKKALQVGPFVCPNGPIMEAYLQAKHQHMQALRQKQEQEQKQEQLSHLQSKASIDWSSLPFPNVEQRSLVLMVSPNVEHGLGIFLSMVKACSQDPLFQNYEFAVLETEDNQFLLNTNSYTNKNQELNVFTQETISKVKVFGMGHDINDLLAKSRVLIMPTLSLVSNSSLGLQSLSHGVPIITTSQNILKEQLKDAATYVDVDQELIDNLYLAPEPKQVSPWVEALKNELLNDFDRNRIWLALEHSDFIGSCRRLALGLKPLLAKRAGDNPQLLRLGTFSLRAIIQSEIEAQKKEAQRVANLATESQTLDEDNKELSKAMDTSSYNSLTNKRKQAYSTQAPNSLSAL